MPLHYQAVKGIERAVQQDVDPGAGAGVGTCQRARAADAGDGVQGQQCVRAMAVRAGGAPVDGTGLQPRQREGLPGVLQRAGGAAERGATGGVPLHYQAVQGIERAIQQDVDPGAGAGVGPCQRSQMADAGDGDQGQPRVRAVAVRGGGAHVDGDGL